MRWRRRKIKPPYQIPTVPAAKHVEWARRLEANRPSSHHDCEIKKPVQCEKGGRLIVPDGREEARRWCKTHSGRWKRQWAIESRNGPADETAGELQARWLSDLEAVRHDCPDFSWTYRCTVHTEPDSEEKTRQH